MLNLMIDVNDTYVLSQDTLQYLKTQIDPLGGFNDMGIDLYCRAKVIVSSSL